MADLTPSPGAQVANGTYSLTNPLTGTNGTAATAPRSDMRPTVSAPGTVSTITSGASPGNGAGNGFATDTHIHGAPSLASAPTLKYKTATQVFTTNTTFADVAASSGSFAFAIAANEVWEVTYLIPLTFGGTGGAKFQLTGPSSPTNVDITGTYGHAIAGSLGAFESRIATVTAFSSDINSQASIAATTGNVEYTNNAPTGIEIVARIINGANAGTVTLQAAQNNSNSTTTLGLGCFMNAQKVA